MIFDLSLIQGTFSFKEVLHRRAIKPSDLQRKITWFCSRADLESILFRQYLCDVSTNSLLYWRKMTAWSSAFDCGVARPLVLQNSLSLIENVHGGDLQIPPYVWQLCGGPL